MLFRLLYWIFRERRKYKIPPVEPVELKPMRTTTTKSIDFLDGKIISNIPNRPIAYHLLCIWGIFEVFLLSIVFIMKTKDFGENFLHGLCAHDSCDRFVFKALIYKIVCAILLTVGSKTVSFRFFFSFVFGF